MKILISHSYFLFFDTKEASFKKPYPPLAPLIVSGIIKKELNIDVEFSDVMFDHDEKGLVDCINRIQPDILIVYDDDFNYLTKMCLENMRTAILQVLKNVNKKGLFIVHGSDSSDQAQMYLKAGFDYVIHQNAEKTVVELLTAYKKDSESIKKINGISYLSDGKYIKNDPQKQNYPIENAVMPLWEKINIEPYRKMWKEAHGYFSLNISTSHGCPYSCNWCAKPLYGRTYTSIPAKEAANQFAYLANTLKADHVWVTDDIFALKAGWINEFAQELEQLNVKLPLRCQNRADLITDEFAKNLARAGCVELWLGAESGSQKVLDAMNKRVTIEQIKNATKHLQKYKIKVGFFLQYGYPGEEMEDIEKTFSMIKDALPDYVGVSVSYPLKDTPFYESVKAEMVEKKNWKDSGDLAIMFQGKYHPDFYRALYSYTHHYFGYVSLFKRQPIKQTIKRSIQLLKHIPGMIKYKHLMRSYT